MKTRLFLSLVLLGAFVWITACASTSKKSGDSAGNNVVFDKGGIVIPGTNVSKEDRDAMNRILSRYDKSLYRISTYENGKLLRTQGTMRDVITDKKLASQMAANIKKPGFTSLAGLITNPLNFVNIQFPKHPKLLSQLKPVLEKYQAK
jgi:hypothetical protein